jgi:hypothetical protein
MAYTLPVFNVATKVWNVGNTPDDGPADFTGVLVQFYIYSRVSFDVQPCDLELYQPPIQVRMPIASSAVWSSGQIWEVPEDSGFYYRARFKDRVHLNFPNEYNVVFVVQCGSDGIPILRDIENAEPCGGPDPTEHVAEGSGEIDGGVTGGGGAQRNPAGGSHDAFGLGSIEGDIEGDGEANRESSSHSASAASTIAGDIDGTGEANNIP